MRSAFHVQKSPELIESMDQIDIFNHVGVKKRLLKQQLQHSSPLLRPPYWAPPQCMWFRGASWPLKRRQIQLCDTDTACAVSSFTTVHLKTLRPIKCATFDSLTSNCDSSLGPAVSCEPDFRILPLASIRCTRNLFCRDQRSFVMRSDSMSLQTPWWFFLACI